MILTAPNKVDYPSGDGKPIAENTKQYRWVTTIKGGLHALFRDRNDVFVAGDLCWYPVEGDKYTVAAPDVMVVFGRPPGERMSYRQFEEDGIAPQVAFEIMSPSNTQSEMAEKRAFYERHGVLEYYVYDPDRFQFSGWRRVDGKFARILKADQGFKSPLLGVTFGMADELEVVGPDGRKFVDYPVLAEQRDLWQERAGEAEIRAINEAKRATDEAKRAEQEANRAEQETKRAEELAQREAAARKANNDLLAILKAHGIDPAVAAPPKAD